MTGSHRPAVEKNNSGFTLVEIAMVLFIVTLLMAGLVPTINAQLEQQRTNETRKKISEIKEALIGFAIANGRLPCSADGTKIAGQADYGTERASCSALNAYGVVPWITLGTSETDGWGHRFTYRVTNQFADSFASATYTGGCVLPNPIPIPTQASFALCSVGNVTVKTAAAGTPIALTPAIIISHGKNGYGAYTPAGGTPPLPVPVGNADEVANADSDLNYVSHAPTPVFDDLVDWISPNILFNRMVVAGKLP